MKNLIVVSNPDKWILNISNTQVVSPRRYIVDSEFAQLGKYKVFNLCDAFNYQNLGYYVSLLARARMHNPEPSVMTIMDFTSHKMMIERASDAGKIADKVLINYDKKTFKLDVCFGKCLESKYNRIGHCLFEKFQAPMFTATFKKRKNGWKLHDIDPFSASDIRRENREFITLAAESYLARRHKIYDWQDTSRYALAILADETEEEPSSNVKAIARFVRAAQNVGFYCEVIGKDDFDRLNEFDALFIRSTTNVNNYTYKFSRCAHAEGIVVVDDPISIVRCANKVFQAEQATMKKVPIPKTVIVHKANVDTFSKQIGFPLVIKQPDSQFSQGVFKADNEEELEKITKKLFKHSALLIAQEFVPTKFDWRIGIFNRKPIYACKYYMARSHWQIVNKKAKGSCRYGGFETLEISAVPKKILDIALKMANLIGDGLYGVDLKETSDGRILMIEVNDNPNIDAGIEDKVAGQKLYLGIMQELLNRVNKIKKLQPAQ